MSAAPQTVANMWVLGAPTEDINVHYSLGKTLGQPGMFGKAVLATKLKPAAGDPSQYAVKIINKARFSRNVKEASENYAAFRQEIEVLKRLSHPNVIKFYEAFEDREHLYLVTELCTGGELFDRITARGHYTEKDAALVLRQIFDGVHYLHTHKIAHCDLKPDNFLFKDSSENSVLKIIDFGMSKFLHPRKYFTKFCGTPYYVAPEVIQGLYTESCDAWSLGVIMFVVLHGYPPFYADPKVYAGQEDRRVFQLIRRGFDPTVKDGYGPHFPKAIPISEPARELISKLLSPDTKKRLTAQEALDHPWMTGEHASESVIPVRVLRSLRSLAKISKLKALVLETMSDSLSDEEIKDLKIAFQNMDENKDGTISVTELAKVLQRVDKTMQHSEIERIVAMADADNDGVLNINELMMTYVQRKLNAKEERLWESFCRLDLNGDGFISKDELQKIVGSEDAQRVQALLSEVDRDNNGSIDYNEFLTLWFPPPADIFEETQSMRASNSQDSLLSSSQAANPSSVDVKVKASTPSNKSQSRCCPSP